MYYSIVRENDVANGPGIRTTIFVSGCHHKCKGCFNEDTWDFKFGQPFTDDTISQIINAMKPEYISGITLLGGEPFELVNQEGLVLLMREVKKTYPDKNVWCYSGFTYEELVYDMMPKRKLTQELLSYIDILVDGKFVLELKDLTLRFRGSSNQRIIDMKKSFAANKLILWDEKGYIEKW